MTISSDSIGNVFVGGTYAPTATWLEFKNDFDGAVTQALGSATRYASSGVSNSNWCVGWRPNAAVETLTGQVSTPVNSYSVASGIANARFLLQLTASSSLIVPGHIRTGSGNTFIALPQIGNSFIIFLTDTSIARAVISPTSIAFSLIQGSNVYFAWQGLLSAPQNPATSFPLFAASLAYIRNGSNIYLNGCRARALNTTVSGAILTSGEANYPISCSDGQTQGDATWTTDLWLRDNDNASNNPAVGRCANLLLAKGSFTIGNIYRVNALVGSSTNRFYVCAAPFGSDFILMRIGE